MILSHFILAALSSVSIPIVGGPSSQAAAPASLGTFDMDGAVHDAALFLLGSQEKYESDPPVGSLPEAKLADWQQCEAKRLADLSGEELVQARLAVSRTVDFVLEAVDESPDLSRLLQRTRDENGTWNDRIFPRTSSYSTAMSILALRAPSREPMARWAPM